MSSDRRLTRSTQSALLVQRSYCWLTTRISFWQQYAHVFDQISEHGSDVRAVVLSSANPKLFTAGLDLHATSTLTVDDTTDPARRALDLRKHILEFQRAIGAPERCPVPVIAAVHGLVLGLGIDILGYCDVRFAASNASFSIKVRDYDSPCYEWIDDQTIGSRRRARR